MKLSEILKVLTDLSAYLSSVPGLPPSNLDPEIAILSESEEEGFSIKRVGLISPGDTVLIEPDYGIPPRS